MITAATRILLVATMAGFLAGIFATAAQQVAVVPFILEAETYENASADGHAVDHSYDHDHDRGIHGGGLQRTVGTTLANILTAIGFALLLVAGFSLHGKAGAWRGLAWGAAGFVVFQAAPALGLPPELPGAAAADLATRQTWWFFTVTLTAGGLALVVFSPVWGLKLMGLILLAGPHVYGAPQPAVHGGLAPEELVRAFIVASLACNAAFWLVLGAITGFLFRRVTPAVAES